MEIFGNKLRERAEALGISNAEAARRCGLHERRYAHYTQGIREPDLQTLVMIARTLTTTPNELLGVTDPPQKDERDRKIDRLLSAVSVLTDDQLSTVLIQTEALAADSGEKPSPKPPKFWAAGHSKKDG